MIIDNDKTVTANFVEEDEPVEYKFPYFEVEITAYPEEAVYYGEEFTVRGEVKNTGGAASQDILFGFGEHHAEAKEDIELDSG